MIKVWQDGEEYDMKGLEVVGVLFILVPSVSWTTLEKQLSRKCFMSRNQNYPGVTSILKLLL